MKRISCLLVIFAGIVIKHDVEAAPRALLGGLGQCLLANCFVDPCMVTTCPTGTTCSANYCGGCNAECVHSNLLDLLHSLG